MNSYKERTEEILRKADERKKQKKRRIKFASIAASCLSFILIINLVLFLPYSTAIPSVSKYKNSEYYSIIQQLNVLTYKKPVYKNNFERWFSNLKLSGGTDYGDSPSVSEGEEAAYREVTDNQTEGVIEGDLFKRSDRYIYYLNQESNGYELQIYSIADKNSEKVSSFDIQPETNTYFYGYFGKAEMYLSQDARTVTVISPVYHKNNRMLYTVMIGIDVSDPENITENARQYVSGNYITSRSVGDDILLLTQFNVNGRPNFSDETQYIPQTGALDNLKSLPIGDIVYPESADYARYTVVCKIDGRTLQTEGHYAFLSYTDTAYISASNIFTTRSYISVSDYVESMTEVSCISYDGGDLEYVDSVTVAGTVLNQYSMDEYEDVLRVATTVTRSEKVNQRYSYSQSASLYCVDLTTFDVIGSLEWFAPLGEEVQSARFDKNTAYVCTAVELTDPVFAIDLSDPTNIVYKDTGEIYGYSVSLTTFAYDTLLGIGYGESASVLKIELYREGESSLESVAKYEKSASFSTEYKAYFIDKQNGLIGLGLSVYPEGDIYLLLRFDGYNLVELYSPPVTTNSYDAMRAVYIDGYVYILSGYDLQVACIDN